MSIFAKIYKGTNQITKIKIYKGTSQITKVKKYKGTSQITKVTIHKGTIQITKGSQSDQIRDAPLKGSQCNHLKEAMEIASTKFSPINT